mgnify:CR=1 FL=1
MAYSVVPSIFIDFKFKFIPSILLIGDTNECIHIYSDSLSLLADVANLIIAYFTLFLYILIMASFDAPPIPECLWSDKIGNIAGKLIKPVQSTLTDGEKVVRSKKKRTLLLISPFFVQRSSLFFSSARFLIRLSAMEVGGWVYSVLIISDLQHLLKDTCNNWRLHSVKLWNTLSAIQVWRN